ncbi:centrosomal protein of 131 kDa-like isoform X1 [Spodoptera frugiperda]|uniref:Centrosomal protein of 131 kDa-like isoform X1 n=1 Tax=Spodoptera frugiperda TaxID=7108 RepID=A0A9R0D4Z3_SPOFR|nr:centrosomal protein of 131 kDa-like isoform X1 [Spodoptera frugiperda]
MSKENNNLRLMGSPVNLSYRSKKKDDKRNIRNRPRSALQSTVCITPDHPERYKRPFSADTKDRAPTTRNFLKAFSAELLQSYNNSPTTTIKIVAPTTDLLRDTKSIEPHSSRNKEICSNASDYGSEDTFISLGTKIKAKAQLGTKKNVNSKNFVKYRNIAKKNRKSMENSINEDVNPQEYGLEVKIVERTHSPTRLKNIYHGRPLSPSFKTRAYESYFIPLEEGKKSSEFGHGSYGETSIQSEVEKAIDTYNRRLTISKQQLSLVEEESTQDLDSVPSQHMSSLSPEISLEDKIAKGDHGDNLTNKNSYDFKGDDYHKITQSYICESRTYTSFFDEFRANPTDEYKTKLSSTVVHTDSSSKDSGYPDSGPNDDRFYTQNYSLPNTSMLKKSNSHDKVEEQPKSLDSVSTNSNDKVYHKSYLPDRNSQWAEPLNHSRLLYKDFFLKKEGHIALAPQNSPNKTEVHIPGSSEGTDELKSDNTENNLDYPPYLINSTTKAYTSKVIEDYKKELEAINNLHDLTLKDIQTDAISPTPLNIDKMFEDASNFDDKMDNSENSQESTLVTQPPVKMKNSTDARRDVSKISTKELIQNYLKVKESDYGNGTKNLKKPDRKINNGASGESSMGFKQEWNNKSPKGVGKNQIPVNIRNQTQKNMFTIRTPMSARIESVQHDKDIDSWMSLSAPSPRIIEVEEIPIEADPKQPEPVKLEGNIETERPAPPPPPPDDKPPKSSKELNNQSTVLDIYSMLKEIESYGENPVVEVTNTILTETESKKEEDFSPKDNFMEIFEFLEKVEQSANDALSVVTNTTPQSTPKLETLLKLPQTELAQRLVTASLQLEERSCCIALLQESLANHKEQMINKVSNLEKQSNRNISKVKQECENTIKRHQNFIDQLINDKKTLNHRIEQLVDERRALEERWKRSAQALEERYKLELRNQHDKMQAAQQVARQRWVRQKAEKIKELTVKGLEGELREMAERQQKEVSDLKMSHAEQTGRMQAKHAQDLEDLRRELEEEKEAALVKERHLASSRLEKQILEIELTYQEQRTRLVSEMRAENERVAAELAAREKAQREELEKWREEQEKEMKEKRMQMELEIIKEREKMEEQIKQKEVEMKQQLEEHKKQLEVEQQLQIKRKTAEIAAQHKHERDREIERAIDNMEAEAQAGRRELQDALRRNKEQYEAELKELAETEQATLRRYQDAQARIRQTEDKCAELEVTISQLETRNRVLTEKNTQLETRADEVRAQCAESWQGKLEALQREIEEMKKTHEEQMHQLYAKVKVAVARKDSAIQALTREAGKYQEKITLLEQKLQQQRKDFLQKK